MDTIRDNIKAVYICAPYRANETHTEQENIDYAKGVAEISSKDDILPIVPHLMFGYMDESTERDKILARCKWVLEFCDELWVCSDTCTEGMIEEVKHAFIENIPVIRIGRV